MNRRELEHLIRAAAAVTDQYEIVVIGSQSILGAEPNAPDFLLQSMEADMYPLHRPEMNDLIDGSIGEGSPFQTRFGYYAQGVGPETAKLPRGWESRLTRIQNQNTDLKIGYCLDPHDLAASKLAAGRDKDWDFVNAMIEYGIAQPAVLKARVETLPIPAERVAALSQWVDARVRAHLQSIEEKKTRADKLPQLALSHGVEYTFWRHATAAVNEMAGRAEHVDWNRVEAVTAAESIGEHGLDWALVADVLCRVSPGAVSQERQVALRDKIKAMAPELISQWQQRQALDGDSAHAEPGK